AATWDAARFLGREGVAGTVEVGKEADLVLLDGDPTEGVGGLHAVGGVVRGGKYYDGEGLEGLKEGAVGR
ncbi:MAG: amidohydrolase family protein, partial [Umezawaea sp.]